MNVLSFPVSNDLHERVEALAREQGISTERMLAAWTEHAVREHEARALFEKLAEDGKGKEEEALLLLAKARGE